MTDLAAAAAAIRDAKHLLITAGAGIGVDSGLPDFRGNEGFWNAYPPYRRLRVGFTRMANPEGFARDPPFAWGFYGHRLHLYRQTIPHDGFAILRRWAERIGSVFVVTSNVDGQFQRAGFSDEDVFEVHGSIHHLQCAQPCHDTLWSADGTEVEIDVDSMRAVGALPSCRHCGGVARPNILMFGDFGFLSTRTEVQESRYESWLQRVGDEPLTVVEAGAGVALPTIRRASERQHHRQGARLVRINPTEPRAPAGEIGLALGALEALTEIDALLTPPDTPPRA